MKTNEDRQRPIAVFDSGMGGISVLKELCRLMPQEDFIYMGDSKNAPYGERETEDVYRLSKGWVEYFIGRRAKAIVIACNTATSAAAARLREEYPELPIIGLEPALKPAALAYGGTGRTIVVLATSLTLREEKFKQLLAQYRDKARICQVPAPELVELVEQDDIDSARMDDYLSNLFIPYIHEDIAAVVLGCTHFPFAKHAIAKALGREIQFFDGALGASKQLRRQLEHRQLLADRNRAGNVLIENSTGSPKMLALSERLFAK